ncbi:hypothetical protein O6H91_06G098800 [Diphasiastrum complanatum]|uniref:Uncharacterized protein n=3 Tax=Diphasiastrum complanatum TaxID=34168 RepID=A0ACC2DGT6_DIPCM|nr:hypothetical protein O6H91_06G098800 [Diphasiastrum complanatum]KAJ7553457.1 hypothetical protein O6H91_06G098800 [Diphasiastrum complanatum]KAJ7553458.1 hypothetical protein O6H91_06G098800 [Diphasiastrum complanatum]
MRSGVASNSRQAVAADGVRQTRGASKRAAMDDAQRATNSASVSHSKKRPALANLPNNNPPAAPLRPSLSKAPVDCRVPATKGKSRSSSLARDVETQMAGLSVVQKRSFISSSGVETMEISEEAGFTSLENNENVPPDVSRVYPQILKQNADADLPMDNHHRLSPVQNTLPLQQRTPNVLISGNPRRPVNQGPVIEERSFPGEKCFTDIDSHKDPQMCSFYAPDIYQHLRIAELKRRPVPNFMEAMHHEINASMRGILVDWLVEVAEEYKLVPDTLYLTVSYIDRFLSVNLVNRQRLQLLGVACMLIAAKYEEICAPQVEEFCYITDNTYCREEVLDMERRVLSHLHFELTTPTTKTFLRRFVRAAQTAYKVTSLQLEFLGNYLAELTLVEYSFLQYLPSMVAASAVFLAKLTMDSERNPWNTTLQHYTGYQPSVLKDCVQAMFELQCNTHNCTLPAIREKYRQHKFKSVSALRPPTNLPSEFFLDL